MEGGGWGGDGSVMNLNIDMSFSHLTLQLVTEFFFVLEGLSCACLGILMPLTALCNYIKSLWGKLFMQNEVCTSQWAESPDHLCTTILHPNQIHHFYFLPFREQPIFSTRAHVFQIDPNTKKNWVPTSKHAVTVSYFYDSTRNVYRIISLDGSKVRSY